MSPEGLLQTGTGITELLLFHVVYLVGFACMAGIIFLAFRVPADYHDGVYVLLGVTGALCFAFSLGGEHYTLVLPGFIWLSGILLLAFVLGLFIGFLLPFDADVKIRKPLEPKR